MTFLLFVRDFFATFSRFLSLLYIFCITTPPLGRTHLVLGPLQICLERFSVFVSPHLLTDLTTLKTSEHLFRDRLLTAYESYAIRLRITISLREDRSLAYAYVMSPHSPSDSAHRARISPHSDFPNDPPKVCSVLTPACVGHSTQSS